MRAFTRRCAPRLASPRVLVLVRRDRAEQQALAGKTAGSAEPTFHVLPKRLAPTEQFQREAPEAVWMCQCPARAAANGRRFSRLGSASVLHADPTALTGTPQHNSAAVRPTWLTVFPSAVGRRQLPLATAAAWLAVFAASQLSRGRVCPSALLQCRELHPLAAQQLVVRFDWLGCRSAQQPALSHWLADHTGRLRLSGSSAAQSCGPSA